MSRRSDQLDRIEQAFARIEGRLLKLEDAVDLSTSGGLSAVAADAKGARSSAEASFAASQALASVATAKPGPAEIAAAIEQGTVLNRGLADGLLRELASVNTQIRSLAVALVPKPARTDMPGPPATPMTPVAKAPKN